MPLGIPGFAQTREFIILDHSPNSIFRWFQSLEMPELAFVVIDPRIADPNYPLDVVRRALSFLNLDVGEDIVALGICTVPPPPEQPTVNLLAPMGIGADSRRGAQVVLHETRYDPRVQFLAQPTLPTKQAASSGAQKTTDENAK